METIRFGSGVSYARARLFLASFTVVPALLQSAAITLADQEDQGKSNAASSATAEKHRGRAGWKNRYEDYPKRRPRKGRWI